MAPSLKRLLNKPEAVVHARLLKVCEPHGAKVFPKVRLADVLSVPDVAAADLSFALKAHFDFTVVDDKDMPLFAVEFDGPTHGSTVQQRRDRTKDALCKQLGLPLLRIRETHLEVYRTYDLLSWIVEQWFLRERFDEAQAKGHIPHDELFDPDSILGERGEPPFPMWLSLDAQNGLRTLKTAGKILDGYPSFTIGIDDDGSHRGLFWLEVRPSEFAHVTTGARAQNFPVILSDLLSYVGIIKLFERTKRVVAGTQSCTSEPELHAHLDRHKRLQLARACGHSRAPG